jgi:hypothetical protein
VFPCQVLSGREEQYEARRWVVRSLLSSPAPLPAGALWPRGELVLWAEGEWFMGWKMWEWWARSDLHIYIHWERGERIILTYNPPPPPRGRVNKTHNKNGTCQQNEVCRLGGTKYKLWYINVFATYLKHIFSYICAIKTQKEVVRILEYELHKKL